MTVEDEALRRLQREEDDRREALDRRDRVGEKAGGRGAVRWLRPRVAVAE